MKKRRALPSSQAGKRISSVNGCDTTHSSCGKHIGITQELQRQSVCVCVCVCSGGSSNPVKFSYDINVERDLTHQLVPLPHFMCRNRVSEKSSDLSKDTQLMRVAKPRLQS